MLATTSSLFTRETSTRRTMIPLLARKYLYRYLILAIVLPLVAKILLTAGHRIERRNDNPTALSRLLIKIGSYSRRKARTADADDHQEKKRRSIVGRRKK
ncbi:MAG: hypothetical protein C0482_22390 [Gordonia sp.]|jgi:hypothetical protein|uniref:Uncharacterized protein n=1 Tax=Gordonia rubripertincta TaxID=36822 RepID=A0ABT4MYR8_GORRU|nr:hypothetical protein [Gordonia rubripertincta]MBA4025113.1 hypothetical protein [Gordonia sp. (in: high G+C Gram-positive bacteria)]MCZ4552155.1 hypothetical protein [Gordonia rubripertincta]